MEIETKSPSNSIAPARHSPVPTERCWQSALPSAQPESTGSTEGLRGPKVVTGRRVPPAEVQAVRLKAFAGWALEEASEEGPGWYAYLRSRSRQVAQGRRPRPLTPEAMRISGLPWSEVIRAAGLERSSQFVKVGREPSHTD